MTKKTRGALAAAVLVGGVLTLAWSQPKAGPIEDVLIPIAVAVGIYSGVEHDAPPAPPDPRVEDARDGGEGGG